MILDLSTQTRSSYTVKLYRDVDIGSFLQGMERIKHRLSKINNGNDMWTLFSSTLLWAVDKHVPKKSKFNLLHSEPMWFNSDSCKKAKKQRILYNKLKKTYDPYDRKQYLECRKNTKKAVRKIKKDYLENHICKPTKEGNSKLFYQHPKGPKNDKMFRFTKPYAIKATDALSVPTY